ncbi:unnamed protein product [Cladocopium goreaui]|uniref:Ankyrin repeat domain-containing protein 65 n=1 Tax=Cladocopium goreaui TaxID=2562237 RepID=A0A9P1FRL2_9DINO|nr:unnamed protein product [Cladocopium goreaui]
MPDDLVLAVFDEGHEIFRTNQRLFQEVRAQHKLILSDLSQSFLLDNNYPEMRRVNLTEVVRSTKRVAFGANAFQLQDGEPTTCLGTTGPPLKSFIFEVPEGYDGDLFAHFAQNTVEALWFILQRHPSMRLDRHVALLVPDEHFHMIFKSHLEERLEADFAPTYNIQLVSFEESLRFLPEAVHQDRREDELILDWDTNAKGLEQLFIICIGFDAQITGDTDNFTRARLYHAITRAQLQAIVVDRFVRGGWLEFLNALKLKETTFQADDAKLEIKKDAALKIVEETTQSEADSRPEAATKAPGGCPRSMVCSRGFMIINLQEPTVVEVLPTSIWDTSSNMIKTKIAKLKFDPRHEPEGRSGVRTSNRTLGFRKFCNRVATENDVFLERDIPGIIRRVHAKAKMLRAHVMSGLPGGKQIKHKARANFLLDTTISVNEHRLLFSAASAAWQSADIGPMKVATANVVAVLKSFPRQEQVVQLSSVVTEEWFSVSSGFQYLVTAQRQPLFSMLSGLDTAGKDLPALAELQQANDNLKEKLKTVESQLSDASREQELVRAVLDDLEARRTLKAATASSESLALSICFTPDMHGILSGILLEPLCLGHAKAKTPQMRAKLSRRRTGRTELHNAVCSGDKDYVQQLLKNRAFVDATDRSGRTPLHLAASELSEPVKIIELLLEARARTQAEDLSGPEPQRFHSLEFGLRFKMQGSGGCSAERRSLTGKI